MLEKSVISNTRAARVAGVVVLLTCAVVWPEVAVARGADYVEICTDAGAGGYEAFPRICRLKDGRLMCSFMAGYGHVSLGKSELQQAEAHGDEWLKSMSGFTLQQFKEAAEKWPDGSRSVYCISSDEGRTWGKPVTMYDSPLGDGNASIIQLTTGRLIAVTTCEFAANVYSMHSDDAGKTWSEPRVIVPGYYPNVPIRELSDGRMILGIYYQGDSTKGDTKAFGAVVISDDNCETWSKPIDIDSAGCWLDAETDVIELKDGKLYAAQRNGGNHPMMYSISEDRGETWSISAPMGFAGHAPYFHRTENGVILVGYRDLYSRNTSLRYSLDECKTWSKPVMVDRGMGAYTSFVDLKDGSVFVVYYVNEADIRGRRFFANKYGVRFLEPFGTGQDATLGLAWNPSPGKKSPRVGPESTLTWSPGNYAKEHKIYFGSEPEKLKLTKTLGKDDPCVYEPKGLEQGRTYYWRIDEIDKSNPDSPWKGDLWSFTVGKYTDYLGAGHWDDEYTRQLPYRQNPPGHPGGLMKVTAGASSSSTLPVHTVDGLGLSDLKHETSWRSMWFWGKGASNPNPGTVPCTTWLKYDFGQVYKLGTLWVWNCNLEGSPVHYGLRNVTIEYSTTGGSDAGEWKKLGDYEFAMAPEPGSPDYTYNTEVDFGGVEAKYVVISAHMTDGNWGDPTYYGLSEVRFNLAAEK
jgi:hypothetical protein